MPMPKALVSVMPSASDGRPCANARATGAAHGWERTGVILLEVGALEQVPRLGGYADEVRHLVALDQLQGALRLPAMHHHQLEMPREAAHHHRDAPGDVKERHDQDEARRH